MKMVMMKKQKMMLVMVTVMGTVTAAAADDDDDDGGGDDDDDACGGDDDNDGIHDEDDAYPGELRPPAPGRLSSWQIPMWNCQWNTNWRAAHSSTGARGHLTDQLHLVVVTVSYRQIGVMPGRVMF
jgi:hypothetical protein